MSVLPGDDQRALGLEHAERVDGAGRVGAVEDEVARDEHGVRLLAAERRPDRLEGERVAVDVGEDGDAASAQHPGAAG